MLYGYDWFFCMRKEIHKAEDLVRLFNDCFLESEKTELVGNNPEPEYLPNTARNKELHAILFTRDYFASGLHEISHWCIAGKERRKKIDYGYWYCPDGRTKEQQTLFEQVEVEPQALEWIFAESASFPFRLSFDNLNGSPVDAKGFADRVHKRVMKYLDEGVNQRSAKLISTFLNFYRNEDTIDPTWFDRSKLGYIN